MDELKVKAAEVLANLKGWNFDIFPSYSLGEPEAEKIIEVLEAFREGGGDNGGA
jgi:hypothetical protein